MSLLAPGDQQKLREAFDEMRRPVRLQFFTQSIGCETCEQTKQILAELPPLSNRISVEELNVVLDKERAVHYGFDRAPAIAIESQDEAGQWVDSRIRFLGAPSGYEFMSLVQAVLLAGGRAPALSAAAKDRLAAVDQALTIQVFTTPT